MVLDSYGYDNNNLMFVQIYWWLAGWLDREIIAVSPFGVVLQAENEVATEIEDVWTTLAAWLAG